MLRGGSGAAALSMPAGTAMGRLGRVRSLRSDLWNRWTNAAGATLLRPGTVPRARKIRVGLPPPTMSAVGGLVWIRALLQDLRERRDEAANPRLQLRPELSREGGGHIRLSPPASLRRLDRLGLLRGLHRHLWRRISGPLPAMSGRDGGERLLRRREAIQQVSAKGLRCLDGLGLLWGLHCLLRRRKPGPLATVPGRNGGP